MPQKSRPLVFVYLAAHMKKYDDHIEPKMSGYVSVPTMERIPPPKNNTVPSPPSDQLLAHMQTHTYTHVRKKIETCSYYETFEYEWSSYYLFWAATKKTQGWGWMQDHDYKIWPGVGSVVNCGSGTA
jgi:hypothetical protein